MQQAIIRVSKETLVIYPIIGGYLLLSTNITSDLQITNLPQNHGELSLSIYLYIYTHK